MLSFSKPLRNRLYILARIVTRRCLKMRALYQLTKLPEYHPLSKHEQPCVSVLILPYSHSSFLDNRLKSEDTHNSHRVVDRLLHLPSTSRDVESVLILPYFPHGLAVSEENITDFNFTLFLCDSLQFPAGLFQRILPTRLSLQTSRVYRQYCSLLFTVWRNEPLTCTTRNMKCVPYLLTNNAFVFKPMETTFTHIPGSGRGNE